MTSKETAPLLLDLKLHYFYGSKERLYAFGVDSSVLHPDYAIGWRRLKACNLRIDTNWEVFHEGEFLVAVFDMGVADSPPMFIKKKEVPALKRYIEIVRPKTVLTL